MAKELIQTMYVSGLTDEMKEDGWELSKPISGQYKTIKSISHPMGSVKKGTISVIVGDYFMFPYIGNELDDIDKLGVGLMWHKNDIRNYPEWFKKIK